MEEKGYFMNQQQFMIDNDTMDLENEIEAIIGGNQTISTNNDQIQIDSRINELKSYLVQQQQQQQK